MSWLLFILVFIVVPSLVLVLIAMYCIKVLERKK